MVDGVLGFLLLVLGGGCRVLGSEGLVGAVDSRGVGPAEGFHFRHFLRAVVEHYFHRRRVEVGLRAVAYVGQTVPFVHAEFADADFDVQAEVVLGRDVSSGQVHRQHLLVRLLAAFDLGDEFTLGFGEGPQAAGEAFPPF